MENVPSGSRPLFALCNRWPTGVVRLLICVVVLACGCKRQSEQAKQAEPPGQPTVGERIDSLAEAGEIARATELISSQPLDQRRELAAHLARQLEPDAMKTIATATTDGDILFAVAEVVEDRTGSASAIEWWQHAVRTNPDKAEPLDRLAIALVESDQIDAAVSAWDAAARVAPAQPRYLWSAITALARHGQDDQATLRASAHAERARAQASPEALLAAAESSARANHPLEAANLVAEARALRPGDGRLTFELGDRLLAADQIERAVSEWVDLLICGARGRPWHRHEIGARLETVAQSPSGARALAAELNREHSCKPVEPDDLVSYVDRLRAVVEKTP